MEEVNSEEDSGSDEGTGSSCDEEGGRGRAERRSRCGVSRGGAESGGDVEIRGRFLYGVVYDDNDVREHVEEDEIELLPPQGDQVTGYSNMFFRSELFVKFMQTIRSYQIFKKCTNNFLIRHFF